VLAHTVELALDRESRNRGLLGHDGMAAGSALVIAPCWSIHMFFMRFAIDVVFVRRDGTVVKVLRALKPWRLAAAPGAFAAIECPSDTVAAGDLRRGDRLALRVATSAPASASIAREHP
jgi:uncharacterized membrane protein (UPF0127 family)